MTQLLLGTKNQRGSELSALNLGATDYHSEDSRGRLGLLSSFSNLEGFAAFPVVWKGGTGLLDPHARPAQAVDSSAHKLRRTQCFYFPSAGKGWADVARETAKPGNSLVSAFTQQPNNVKATVLRCPRAAPGVYHQEQPHSKQ